MNAAAGVTVLLADDHALVRAGLRALLEREGAVVVAEAKDGLEAVVYARQYTPGVAFLDVAMDGLNGIEAARQIVAENSGVNVVMLSMHAEPQYLYESARAGAVGYVVKDAAASELKLAIDAVLDGRTYFSGRATGLAVEDYVRRAKFGPPSRELDVLSAREREILELIADGDSSAEMAGRLHVSIRTIETHRQNIMRKLRLHSIAELTKCALRNGLSMLT